MRWLVLSIVVLVAACTEPPPEHESKEQQTRARSAAQASVPEPEARASMVRQVPVSGYSLVRGRPGAFEVRAAGGWPGRALDPVLMVGELRFHEYDFPAPDRIRFAIPDTDALPDGAAAFLQFGDDDASRVVITQSLAVSR